MQSLWQGLAAWPWWPPLTVSAVVGGLPLLGYPVVAIVALMSLGGQPSASDPLTLVLVSRAFLLGALLYPVVYGACVITAFSTRAQNPTAPLLAALPLLYLLGLVALLGLWSVAERQAATVA